MSIAISNLARRAICSNTRILCAFQSMSKLSTLQNEHRRSNPCLRPNLTTITRLKHGKKKGAKHEVEKQDSDDEEDVDEIELDDSQAKSTKISCKVNSLRLDVIVKSGLKISRNKVEQAFYESKIRVNGEKVYKKSHQVSVGDEIDFIVGRSTNNPKFLIVHRVVLVSVQPNAEGLVIKLARDKSLLIEDYEDSWENSGN